MKRKQEIQAAAAKLFGEKGFAASSVRDIAHAVGLGAASLYNHMGSKDELLNSICFRCAEKFSEGMKEIYTCSSSPIDKIASLVELHIDIAMEDQSSITVFNDEWKHLQEPWLTSFVQMRKQYETSFLSIIADGIEQGQLHPHDPYLVYQHVLSSLRWLHQPGRKKRKLTSDQIKEQIISLTVKSIRV